MPEARGRGVRGRGGASAGGGDWAGAFPVHTGFSRAAPHCAGGLGCDRLGVRRPEDNVRPPGRDDPSAGRRGSMGLALGRR